MSKLGDVIDGKYEILKEVGRGGMSIVYLAMDNRLNKQWAVKEIKKKGSNSANQIVVQSLLAEANLMKRLDHPHLPRIVDIIDDGNTIYIVMDYIEGEPLDKLLKAKGAQEQDAVIEWGKQLAEVLDYLHTREPAIIYRDMKPANVMLRPDGTVKLIDFGIAREYKERNSADTVSLGTKGYAAPEQFGGMGQTDARTDVYGWGVTMYHLVTGKNPCEPPYEILPIRNINPKLSSGLEVVIQKCTQLNPDDRFQSFAEVLYALDHLDKIDEPYRKRQKRKLNSFIISAALSAIMLLAGIGTLVGYKATLSNSVNEAIELYGIKSSGGGDVEQLKATIEKYGSEVSDEVLYELLNNYVDVCESKLVKLDNEYDKAVTVANGQMSIEEKKTYEDKEVEIFNNLTTIIDKNTSNLSDEEKSAIYYKVGKQYMERYQYCKGGLDNTYIKNRYDEAAHRYSNVKTADKETLEHTKRVCTIGDVITKFSNAKSGISGNDLSLPIDEIKKTWEDMVKCINEESNDDRKVNLYLIVGDIVFLNRVDYKKLTDLQSDIQNFCVESVKYLQTYSQNNAGNGNMKTKADKAIEYYKDIYKYLTKMDMEV